MFDARKLQNKLHKKLQPKQAHQKIFIVSAAIASLVASGGTTDDGKGVGANNSGDFEGDATEGNDVIVIGGKEDGAAIIDAGAGDDTITGGAAVDFILGGAGADKVNGGAGLDHLVIVGVTVDAGFTEDDLKDIGGTGIDLSGLLDLDTVNNHAVSDAEAGDEIDGGADGAILYLIGTVNLADVSLASISKIYINDDVTISASQLQSLITSGLTEIFGQGSIKTDDEIFDFDEITISADIEIQDKDGAEVAPSATTGAVKGAVTVAEQTTLVGTFTATDASSVGVITYSLTGADADLFEISATGEINFKNAPSVQDPKDAGSDGIYNITAVASDAHGRSTSNDIVISVSDVNNVHSGGISIVGSAVQNGVLSIANDIVDVDGVASINYQWQRNGEDVSGATSATYTPDQDDVGAVISVMVSYVDGTGFTESESSASTSAIANVNDAPAGAISITGYASVDETLSFTDTITDLDGKGTVTYQWTRDGVDISSATNLTYTLTVADTGSAIRVVASYTDGFGAAETITSAAAPDVNLGNVFALASLTDDVGVYIEGESIDDYAGGLVSNIGDINADGFDDFILNAVESDVAAANAGNSYVIFGAAAGIAANIDLSSLDGVNGFRINGDASSTIATDFSAAGDINGDGFDDFLISSSGYDSGKGATYIVFGDDDVYPATLDLTALDAADGFKINGELGNDYAGSSAAGVGDVNGDGYDDILVGASGADPHGAKSGAAYIIFGSATSFGTDFNLSALDGTNGYKLEGTAASDGVGTGASKLGDLNGDGLDDFLIGGYKTSYIELFEGSAYVVFGTRDTISNPIQLADLNGDDGFRVDGNIKRGQLGQDISGLGDINGDGFADFILGVESDTYEGPRVGVSYVVFGAADGFDASFNVTTLTGTKGFKIVGENPGDEFGNSVSAAGDINGDGYADLLIGATGYGYDEEADMDDDYTGAAYIVYGKSGGFDDVLVVADMDAAMGFRIDAAIVNETVGASVSSAGDVNGDGFDDLVIGTTHYGLGDKSGSYILYGGTQFRADDQQGDDVLNGDANDNVLIAGNGDDTVNGLAGDDILRGASGNDELFGGAGADILSGGGNLDIFSFNVGDSVLAMSGTGDAGVVTGFDTITDFETNTATILSETFDTIGAASIVSNSLSGTADSGVFTVDGNSINSHAVSNGVISFDDASGFSQALDISSIGEVAAALTYVRSLDLGDAGATVAFDVGADTFIYTQGSDSGVDDDLDIVVRLEGVQVDSLITSNAFGAFDLFIA